jgi:hypothetical protein
MPHARCPTPDAPRPRTDRYCARSVGPDASTETWRVASS